MTLPQSILVVVDESMHRSPAFHRGVDLARRLKARLHLNMAVFDSRIDAAAELVHPDVERLARDQFVGERLRWLTAETAEIASHGVNVTCEVVWTPTMHEAVIAKVFESGHDLVIRDLEPETFLGRWTSVKPADWKLARLCPVPLMLVKPDSAAPTRIAAAVDPTHRTVRPSELDERIIGIGLPLAVTMNARLDLIHVFPHRREDIGMSAKLDDLIETMRGEDAKAFSAFADSHSVPQDRRTLLGGRSADEIGRFVQDNQVGLLIIGSEYRSGIARFFLGSTAERLVTHAPCDLLLVRPDGFGAALARHYDLEGIFARYGVKRPGKVSARDVIA